MSFLLLFVGGWLLLLGGICALVWKDHRQRAPNLVSDAWIKNDRYKRDGDVPPGTSRQEEGR